MGIQLDKLGRAGMAALTVETLAAQGIDVVPLGGFCVCVWTNEGFDEVFRARVYWKRAGGFSGYRNGYYSPAEPDRYDQGPFTVVVSGRRSQCREQALGIARNHKVNWSDLKKWHAAEGHAAYYAKFREALE